MRILVVEDDRKVARFIQAGLEQEGHAVDVLHEGSGASEQASAIDRDVVVLDLMLPGRSGFQVLRDIRRRTAEMPVLILTGERVVRGWRSRLAGALSPQSARQRAEVHAAGRQGAGARCPQR